MVLATGGYGNVFYLSTNAKGCNVTATWRAHRRGALFANPCFTQIHPTCIPVSGDHQSKLTLMSESLRNDGRVWVPQAQGRRPRPPARSPKPSATTTWSADYPSFGNLVPRDVASRAAKDVCDEGRGVGPAGLRRLPRLRRRHRRGCGRKVIEDRVRQPLRDVRADHRRGPVPGADADLPGRPLHDGRALGRLRPDGTIPGLFVVGEANFSDHGANRLGASALMQGLADGYFVLPDTIADYLASGPLEPRSTPRHPAALRGRDARSRTRIDRLLAIDGDRTVDSFHRELGQLMWEHCGMARTEAGPEARRSTRSASCARSSGSDVRVPGDGEELNQTLEKAGRVADFFELAELMCIDALHRDESCGGHFRVESQTADGEAQRDDDQFAYVAAWEYTGAGQPRRCCTRKPLTFEYVHLTQRSYK